jgi:hypothetical protein
MIKRKHDSSKIFGKPHPFANAWRGVFHIRVAGRNIKRLFREQVSPSAVQLVQSTLRLRISCSFPFSLPDT